MLLPKALLEFRKTDSNIHVQVLEVSSSEQHSQELIGHRTDVAFMRTPEKDEFITSKLLHRQPNVVVLAVSNSLSIEIPCRFDSGPGHQISKHRRQRLILKFRSS